MDLFIDQFICMCLTYEEFKSHCRFQLDRLHVYVQNPCLDCWSLMSRPVSQLDEELQLRVCEKIRCMVYTWKFIRRLRNIEVIDLTQ